MRNEVTYELGSLPDKSDSSVARLVRRQGSFIKGSGYGLAGLLMNDIEKAQLLPYWVIDKYLDEETQGKVDLRHFHAYAERWKQLRRQPSELRRMFRIGLQQLQNMSSFGERVL